MWFGRLGAISFFLEQPFIVVVHLIDRGHSLVIDAVVSFNWTLGHRRTLCRLTTGRPSVTSLRLICPKRTDGRSRSFSCPNPDRRQRLLAVIHGPCPPTRTSKQNADFKGLLTPPRNLSNANTEEFANGMCFTKTTTQKTELEKSA